MLSLGSRLSPMALRTLDLLHKSGGLFARDGRAGACTGTRMISTVFPAALWSGKSSPERTGGVWWSQPDWPAGHCCCC